MTALWDNVKVTRNLRVELSKFEKTFQSYYTKGFAMTHNTNILSEL